MSGNDHAKMSASSSSSYPRNIQKRKVLPTVLNFMDGSCMTSNNNIKSSTDIFDLLRRAVNERRRIEVLTRDCRGIYGILIGWLIVFDKHMNLIMSDVDEVFRRLTDGHDYLELGPKKQNIPLVKCK
jgi:small nuclear ribonucleoprotein (snRNP)-like protein